MQGGRMDQVLPRILSTVGQISMIAGFGCKTTCHLVFPFATRLQTTGTKIAFERTHEISNTHATQIQQYIPGTDMYACIPTNTQKHKTHRKRATIASEQVQQLYSAAAMLYSAAGRKSAAPRSLTLIPPRQRRGTHACTTKRTTKKTQRTRTRFVHSEQKSWNCCQWSTTQTHDHHSREMLARMIAIVHLICSLPHQPVVTRSRRVTKKGACTQDTHGPPDRTPLRKRPVTHANT